MHNNPYFNVFLDHIMNLYKMIEILLKYDNMRIIGLINALNCINNHIITCVNSMFSRLIKSLIALNEINMYIKYGNNIMHHKKKIIN